MTPLEQLRAFARYKTHGGYTWAAVAADGELLCEKCVRENYRRVYAATRDSDADDRDWQVIGLTHSGEVELTDAASCAHCNKVLWGSEEEGAR